MDERFSKVLTDPRFRRFKKKDTQVKIDSRFSQVLETGKKKSGGHKKGDDKNHTGRPNDFAREDFEVSARIDKYGRKGTIKK